MKKNDCADRLYNLIFKENKSVKEICTELEISRGYFYILAYKLFGEENVKEHYNSLKHPKSILKTDSSKDNRMLILSSLYNDHSLRLEDIAEMMGFSSIKYLVVCIDRYRKAGFETLFPKRLAKSGNFKTAIAA